MKCSNCGAEVPDTDKFCVHCGNDLEKQRTEQSGAVGYCPKCGAPLQKGFKFCVACGTPVPDSTSEPTEPPAESGEVPPDGMTFQLDAEDTSEINLPAQNLTVTGPIPYDASAENNNENATFSADEGAVPPEKEEKSKKTNRILTIVIIVLLVLAIAAVAVFLVLHFQGNSNNAQNRPVTTISESEQDGEEEREAAVAPTRRLNDQGAQPSDEDYLERLQSDGYARIEKTKNSWNDRSLWDSISVNNGPFFVGNDIIYTYVVYMDFSKYEDDPEFTMWGPSDDGYHTYYFTYVRFNNVYLQNGKLHYKMQIPKGADYNIADSSGSQHKVSGYSSEEEALNAAGYY